MGFFGEEMWRVVVRKSDPLGPDSVGLWERKLGNDAVRHTNFISARTGFPRWGLTVSTLEMPPKAEIPWHRHACDEVFFVLSGEGEFGVEGQFVSIQNGDAFWAPPGARHCKRATGSTPFVLSCCRGTPLVANTENVDIALRFGAVPVVDDLKEDWNPSRWGRIAMRDNEAIALGKEAVGSWAQAQRGGDYFLGDAREIWRHAKKPSTPVEGILDHRMLIFPQLGFSCGLTVEWLLYGPHGHNLRIRHHCWQSWFVLAGRGAFEIEGKTYFAGEGDFINIPPDRVHRTVNPHRSGDFKILGFTSPSLSAVPDDIETALAIGNIVAFEEPEIPDEQAV